MMPLVEAQAFARSSAQMAVESWSDPAPPYSLGAVMLMTRSRNSLRMFSAGNSCVRSISAAMGFTSFSVKARIILRISSCSRVREKSMALSLLSVRI